MIAAKKLRFEILRDEDNAVAQAYGLRHVLPPELIDVYLSLGIDLPASNGEASQSLPLPARYVIDRAGRVVAADIHANYTKRPEAEASLAALRSIAAP